jgi:ABC-2 type transport system ATP-binding protein
VILDEPTTGVDPVSRRDFWAILGKLLEEKGVTALVSTAYLDEADRFHRVSLFHEGKVMGEGTPAELVATCPAPSPCSAPNPRPTPCRASRPAFPRPRPWAPGCGCSPKGSTPPPPEPRSTPASTSPPP